MQGQLVFSVGIIMPHGSTPYVGMALKEKWQPHEKCTNGTLKLC